MKKQKGITLIALIITIIVMMILVGVTVNVALNGGLFNTASNAKRDTQKEIDKEQLQAAVVASYDAVNGEVIYDKLDKNLPEGFSKVSEGLYKSESEYKFKVNKNGTIVDGEENSNDLAQDLELLQTYFLGEIDEVTGERPGKDFSAVLNNDFENVTEIKFENNNIIDDAQTKINTLGLGSYMTEKGIYYTVPYIEYNNNFYSIEMYGDDNGNIIAESVYTVKNSSSVDLNGTYYCGYGNINYTINDTVFKMTETKDDDGSFDILAKFSNEEKQTVGIIIYEDGMGPTFRYELIYDEGQVVNKILYVPDGQRLAWQSLNGFDFELDGIYVSDTESGKYRLYFYNEHTVDLQKYYDDIWGFPGYDHYVEEGMYYFKYNGINYIDGEPIIVSEDKQTITYKQKTYKKQETAE